VSAAASSSGAPAIPAAGQVATPKLAVTHTSAEPTFTKCSPRHSRSAGEDSPDGAMTLALATSGKRPRGWGRSPRSKRSYPRSSVVQCIPGAARVVLCRWVVMRGRLPRSIILLSHHLVLFGVCLGTGGCFGTESALVHRASVELACPSEQISIVQRADIADTLYDVGACGQRARYSCFWIGSDGTTAVPCVREPDPRRWDPDPLQLASLPRSRLRAGSGLAGRELLRVCASVDDSGCIYRDTAAGGSWRWREPPRRDSSAGIFGP
jgi:hypothetical protein